jgi:hypothetical protein
MGIDGGGGPVEERGTAAAGYALLIAAAPARGALVDVDGALPALAGISPSALLGTATGSVVQLVAPGDPQAVLAALRTAAAHPGPVLVVLLGQLMADRRRGAPHLALTRSTPRSVRYDGLPWDWLSTELRGRPPGGTAVVADLVADPVLWERRGTLDLAGGPTLIGTLAPPPPRHRLARPRYVRALTEILRHSAGRPELTLLHRQVLEHAAIDLTPRMVLGRAEPAGGPDAHALVRAAASDGRYGEAAALAAGWEQAAARTGGPYAPEVAHWLEVQADLAWLAGEPRRAASAWLRVARTRLAGGRGPDDPDVVRAVDQAHHCWQRLTDRAAALTVAEELEPLRRAVPGRHPGALRDLRQRLAVLRGGGPSGG